MKKILLSQGQFALVDNEDFELIKNFRWYAAQAHNKKTWYARHSITGGGCILMHRLILKLKKNDKRLIDHKNRNGLDNRRRNLRIASHSLNRYNCKKRADNKSGYVGVNLHKQSGKWRARIGKDNNRKSLGLFIDPTEAAIAYDKEAIKLWKENAILNFPVC